MNKKHILLIESDENKIDFFTDALEESRLSFLCSTARSIEQAAIMLKHIVPDIVFIDMHIAGKEEYSSLKKIHNSKKTPLILYSTALTDKIQHTDDFDTLNYVQLPGSIQKMAHILQNLLISDELMQ